MRLPARIIAVAASVVCISGSAGLLGCKNIEKEPLGLPASSAESADGAQPGAPANSPKREKQARFQRFRAADQSKLPFERLGFAEIQALVPSLPGAVLVSRPNVADGGRRVNVVHCLAESKSDELKAALHQKLVSLGWQSIRTREPAPKARPPEELLNVSAKNGQYRISIAAQRGSFFDCHRDKKKVKLVMSFFKPKERSATEATSPPVLQETRAP